MTNVDVTNFVHGYPKVQQLLPGALLFVHWNNEMVNGVSSLTDFYKSQQVGTNSFLQANERFIELI